MIQNTKQAIKYCAKFKRIFLLRFYHNFATQKKILLKEKMSDKKITSSSLKKAWKLLEFIKPYKLQFGIGLVFLLLTGISSLAFPKLTGTLVDAENLDNINQIGLILVAVFLAQSVFSYFRIYLFESVNHLFFIFWNICRGINFIC